MHDARVTLIGENDANAFENIVWTQSSKRNQILQFEICIKT